MPKAWPVLASPCQISLGFLDLFKGHRTDERSHNRIVDAPVKLPRSTISELLPDRLEHPRRERKCVPVRVAPAALPLLQPRRNERLWLYPSQPVREPPGLYG